MLTPIFSTVSVVLGLYLIIIHFFVNDPPLLKSDAVYHQGCYDPTHQYNHSYAIPDKLEQLHQKSQENIKLNMYHSRALAPDFDKQVREVALAFETYIDNFYRLKVRTDQDIQYYNSLQVAKKQVETCTATQTLNQEACINDWDNYKQSLTTFDNLKKELQQFIDDKQKYEHRISAIIMQHSEQDETEIQNKYNQQIQQLGQQMGGLQASIAEMRAFRAQMLKSMSLEESTLESLKNMLDECMKNKELIAFYNEIMSGIYRFWEIVPKRQKESVESRIAKKRKIIAGLQTNLRKIKKYGTLEQYQFVETEISIQKKQLSLLQAEITNFVSSEESRYAKCSQDKIKELRHNISDLIKSRDSMKAQYATVTAKLEEDTTKLGDIKKQIYDSHQARQTEISTKFCADQECKSEQQKTLFNLESVLNEVKKQIIDKQIELNFIKSSQDKKFEGLDQHLAAINEIKDCIMKKQFYEELKSHAPTITDVNQKMVGYKENVVKELSDFDL